MVTIIAMQNLIEVSSTSKLCLVASAHELKIVRAAYLRGDRPESFAEGKTIQRLNACWYSADRIELITLQRREATGITVSMPGWRRASGA